MGRPLRRAIGNYLAFVSISRTGTMRNTCASAPLEIGLGQLKIRANEKIAEEFDKDGEKLGA
jgi:hypothetical protein